MEDAVASFARPAKRHVAVGDYFGLPWAEQLGRSAQSIFRSPPLRSSLPPLTPAGAVMKHGWLEKRPGGLLPSPYHRRYFLLLRRPKGLLYYADVPFEVRPPSSPDPPPSRLLNDGFRHGALWRISHVVRYVPSSVISRCVS